MLHFVQRIYQYMPDWADTRLMRLLGWLRGTLRKRLRVEIVSDTADTRSAIGPVLTAGRTPSMDYFLNSFLLRGLQHRAIGTVTTRKLANIQSGKVEPEATFIRCERRYFPQSAAMDYWQIPDAVASIVDLPAGTGAAPDLRGNADNLRRIRKFGLSATVSEDLADFIDFYRRAYLPFIGSRFGDLGIARSESRLARHFRRGGLLWVERDGTKMAAMLFSISDRVARSWVIAPAPGQADAARVGAIGATYKFLIDLAMSENCRSVHLGMSRPNLLDGILVHKKHWGARLVDEPTVTADLYLTWHGVSKNISAWLQKNPLIVRDGDGLSALTSVSTAISRGDLQRHLKRLSSPGLSRILVIGSSPSAGHFCPPENVDVRWLAPGHASGQACLQ